MIEFEVNGRRYIDFISATVTRSVGTLSNDFEFTASAVNGFPPFKSGDKVVAIVDGEKQATGYIGRVFGDEANGSHNVTYSGRDLTADFVNSSIDSLGDISAEIQLSGLIVVILQHIGLDISVIDELELEPFNVAEDNIRPEVGDNCYNFVIGYAKKRQALLTSDGDGNIVITRSSAVRTGQHVQRLNGNQNNNIISQEWDIDDDKRFNRYIVRGQQDPIALNFAGDVPIGDVVDVSGIAVDPSIRTSRQNVIVEQKGYSNAELTERAKWSKKLAQAEANKFTCTVKDHAFNGQVWRENTLVLVNSDAADISRDMLLKTVTFNHSSGGTTTKLDFVEKDVYNISENLAKEVGRQNDAFTLG